MKKLLLGSMITAALLLTTGCGDDDDPVTPDMTTPDTTTPDTTTPDTTTPDTTTPDTTTPIVVNDLEWTPLGVEDDNVSNTIPDGKVPYADALAACQGLGMDLPTLAQLEATKTEEGNVSSSLKGVPAFNFTNAVNSNSVNFALVVWTKDADTSSEGFALYVDNANDEDGNYTVDPDTSNFYTCVKAASAQ